MSRTEIVEALAKSKTVEEILGKVAKAPIEGEMHDLCQEVYLTLLQADEQKLCEMYQRRELNYYIARIVTNQYSSKTSPFYYLFRRRYRTLDNNG